ncbi:uncharacterized protein [Fopius arisanus]|uniref:Uncharacterized protein n=1 Tax=Fopius arisanus TaxID=64838 RepID=A0A9R1TY20_9HYME|nr:PREDICTED: uncharacterized protein LOC105265146 [Fopius arisanus]
MVPDAQKGPFLPFVFVRQNVWNNEQVDLYWGFTIGPTLLNRTALDQRGPTYWWNIEQPSIGERCWPVYWPGLQKMSVGKQMLANTLPKSAGSEIPTRERPLTARCDTHHFYHRRFY